MMNLKQFAKAVEEEVSKRLGDDFTVTAIEHLGNNGVMRSQLCIREKNRLSSPSIHLEEFFEEYEKGIELQTVVDNLLDYYDSVADMPAGLQKITSDLSYEKIKDRIMFKLINTWNNENLLKEIPSIPYLDMSVIFYIYLGEENGMKATGMIRNPLMEYWHMTIGDMYQNAVTNMLKTFPPVLNRLGSVIWECAPENLLDEDTAYVPEIEGMMDMLILSNKDGFAGASVLLYPEIMRLCKEKLGSDFIILPSSVDEVILVPDAGCKDTMDSGELANMIQSINETEVRVEDRLSDHAYRYCSAEDKVICI